MYGADTYGHELRLLTAGAADSDGEGGEIRPGSSYRWRVVPKFAPDPDACPRAEFHLLAADESNEKQKRFAAEAQRLGVGDEAREPDASIEMARLYLKEGFDAEAEALLLKLRQRAYEDERIDEMLSDLYRRTGRQLSLAALATEAEEPRAF